MMNLKVFNTWPNKWFIGDLSIETYLTKYGTFEVRKYPSSYWKTETAANEYFNKWNKNINIHDILDKIKTDQKNLNEININLEAEIGLYQTDIMLLQDQIDDLETTKSLQLLSIQDLRNSLENIISLVEDKNENNKR